MIYKNFTSSKAAFTLIETIIGVAVIALVITAAAALTQSSLQTARATMQDFIAYHQAEEGLEIVRAMRDSNWLQNRSYKDGIGSGVFALSEAAPWKLVLAQAPEDDDLATNEYARILEIKFVEKTLASPEIMKIKSTVYFSRRGRKSSVSLVSELTDWKKGPL